MSRKYYMMTFLWFFRPVTPAIEETRYSSDYYSTYACTILFLCAHIKTYYILHLYHFIFSAYIISSTAFNRYAQAISFLLLELSVVQAFRFKIELRGKIAYQKKYQEIHVILPKKIQFFLGKKIYRYFKAISYLSDPYLTDIFFSPCEFPY